MKVTLINRMARSAALRYGTVGGLLLAMGISAHAALPAGVVTAIEAAGTDLVAAITAVITAFIAFWGLRKLASKMGWG